MTCTSNAISSIIKIIILMYKPFLKRSSIPNPSNNTQTTMPETSSSQKPQKPSKTNDNLMIASKLLQLPNNQYKEKKAILVPLFAQSHSYPPQVAQLINSNPGTAKKTIGAYKEINWISVGNRIQFWITGDRESVRRQFQEQICCVGLGQLKASMLPIKIRNHYILAVAVKNNITLYCLESFTLRIWQTGIRYSINFSWQVQHIQFIDSNKLFFFSRPDSLQLIELVEPHQIIQSSIPFYKKYLPTTFTQPNRTIENVLYCKNKIYILFQQTKNKSWITNVINRLIDEQQESSTFIRFREIKVYSVNESRIDYDYKITEWDVKQKIKNFIEGSNDEVKISSIFIDNDKEEQLGIITTNGMIINFRDIKKGYLVKDPSFLSSTNTYLSTALISTVVSMTTTINRQSNCNVINSLGLNNLTLTNESLLWFGQNCVHGIHAQNIIAQILLRRSNMSQCFLFNSNEWGVFTHQAFYTIRKLPIRHFLITIIFCSITQFDKYQPLSCQSGAQRKMMQRIQNELTPQKMLKYLVEIIISGEKHFTINTSVIELVCKELKGQLHPNYRDWPHKLKPNMGKTQIQITHQILCKIWNLILDLQYKQGIKKKHICESSIYWMAIHQIYYDLVSPLFKLYPSQFKTHKDMIQNIFNSLKSLQNFFELKSQYEHFIRKQAVSLKTWREPMGEDLNQTTSSFGDREPMQIGWVEQEVRRTVSNKIMSQSILQVQQKLNKAVSLTINLMTIYFGLSSQEVTLPSFGELLRNKADQQIIKKVIIANSDFTTLLDIDRKIPQFGLKKDIDFKSWANKMEIQGLQNTNLDLEQLSRVISSTYFGQSLRLLGNRYDLQVKMLQMYEQVIITQRDSLIQRNTLKQRNFINNSLFPEDQQTLLAYKREYFNFQLEQITQQEKKCLSLAVTLGPQGKHNSQNSRVIDQLIMASANKPSLYDHLQNQLRMSGNIEKLSRLQKLKYRQFQRYPYNKKINFQSRFAERELFPNP